MDIILNDNEQLFLNGYFDCMKWLNQDEPLTLQDYDREENILECLLFFHKSKHILRVLEVKLDQAGHDFYLTRNNHGTGFWDKKDIYRHYSDYLSLLSEQFKPSVI